MGAALLLVMMPVLLLVAVVILGMLGSAVVLGLALTTLLIAGPFIFMFLAWRVIRESEGHVAMRNIPWVPPARTHKENGRTKNDLPTP